jgi:transposase
MTQRRRYRSDLTDAQWHLIEPLVTRWRAARSANGGRQPTTDLREIVNAILYFVRTGVSWDYLPHDFPPAKTVYGYFAAWEKDGLTEQIHETLRAQVRAAKGRRVLPTAAIIDSQTVKASPQSPADTTGYDAGKKTKGRKRHIATDTLGLLLVVLVTAASVQDSAAGKRILDTLAAGFPTVTKTWVDGGYNNAVVAHGADLGIDVEVVPRDKEAHRFVLLPRRWKVEQTFGWLVWQRRLARDWEVLPERSRAVVHWAMVGNMTRTLARMSARQLRKPQPKPDASA